jgi:hypothetical protein
MTSYETKIENKLTRLYDCLTIINNEITTTEIPSNGWQEYELDELYFEAEYYREEIKQLELFLTSIDKCKIYKEELFEISYKILYNPSRVSRLLDNGLISYTEAGSFDDL